MSITHLLAVAAGGVVGALGRYLVFIGSSHLLGSGFPFGTLIVNVVGSCAMGVLVEAIALVWNPPNELRLFLAVGLLGSFTTFSTFSLDVIVLYERRAWLLAAVYVIASMVLAIAALFAGMYLTRRLVGAPV